MLEVKSGLVNMPAASKILDANMAWESMDHVWLANFCRLYRP